MARFGYTEAMLAGGVVNDEFLSLMRFEVARAREFYACADAGIPLLPASSRLPVRLARVLYARILDKIEANDFDVYRKRARTSGPEKVGVLVRERFFAPR